MAKNNTITGLDIGSGVIKVLVTQRTKKGGLETLFLAKEASSGVRKGVIIDPSSVGSLIQGCLKKAEEQTGREIGSVYVNVGGSHIFSTNSRGLVSVSRADQKISSEDVERVLQASQTLSLPSNREVLEVLPKDFIVDGEGGIKEVLGMQGVRLEAEVLVLAGFAPYIKNLTQAVLASGLQGAEPVVSSLAGARACLSTREKELGVAFLDIGAGTTDLAVFEEGNLIHSFTLPVGSGHITNDIAIFLKSDIDTAEKIKLEFGTLFFRGPDKKEKIESTEGENLVFSKKQLSKIVEARVSEIFSEINKELKKISRQGKLPSGIVLSGGCAKLPKMVDLAKKELKLPCRIGKPKELSSKLEDPQLSTVCGLALTGADTEEEHGFSFSGKGIGSKLKKIFRIFIP